MGQRASKAAASRATAGAASGSKNNQHIPSIPGKSGAAADLLTGSTRGGGGGRGSRQDEAQRHFLQSQQGASADYKDKLPDDLIRFMTDMGPLKSNKEEATKRRRLPWVASRDDTAASQSPAVDKTRRTENMRLAENIAGFETSRTTSFSHKHDVVDPNDVGLDVVDFYSLLTGKSTIDSFFPLTLDEKDRQQQLRLLEQSMQYMQLPVLLKDSDDTYVGAWPEKAKDLQQEHYGMEELSKTRAKLVLEDLWEIEQVRKRGDVSHRQNRQVEALTDRTP